MHGAHQVVEDHVHDVLVEDPLVPEGLDVELQALQLDAHPVRHVEDLDRAEVGLPRLRADGRELGAAVADEVVAAGVTVGEDLELSHPSAILAPPRRRRARASALRRGREDARRGRQLARDLVAQAAWGARP